MYTITLKLSENTQKKMIEYFADKKRSKTPPYAIFQADEEDTVVTLYESGKAVFQGTSADIDAAMWKEMEQHLNPGKKLEETDSEVKKKLEKEKLAKEPKVYHSATIGSDEVGTGDYFGPVVVTATFVSKEDIPFLEQLGVKDSKKLTDDKIKTIVPQIIKRIPYSSFVLSAKEYNDKYNIDINMNKIKAILHNKALLAMKEKGLQYDYIVVDQFAEPGVYYHYLKGATNVCQDITFLTKAEDKCLSVACASLISRFIFLKEFNKLEDALHIPLPKGASSLVEDAGREIINTYGKEKLKEVAKYNFKNTDRILD